MSRMLVLAIFLLLFKRFANAAQSSGYLDLHGAFWAAPGHDGVVDHAGIKTNMGSPDAMLELMAAESPEALARPDRVALYMNAYNAWTIRLAMDHWPGMASIKEAGGFLASPRKRPLARPGGQTLSLDDLGHGILRRHSPDPGLHFVLNMFDWYAEDFGDRNGPWGFVRRFAGPALVGVGGDGPPSGMAPGLPPPGEGADGARAAMPERP